MYARDVLPYTGAPLLPAIDEDIKIDDKTSNTEKVLTEEALAKSEENEHGNEINKEDPEKLSDE